MGILFCKDMWSRDSNGASDQTFENHIFLGWVVVQMGMKVCVGVSLFSVNLVVDCTIGLTRDKIIKERKAVTSLNLHGKLNLRGNVVKMVKEGVQCRTTVGPHNKGVIHKSKPKFRI